MTNVNRMIPVYFESQGESQEDSRFLMMKIWLMHTGQNRNDSYFSKDVVEKALPTVYNTPILGFIEEDKYGNIDFKDHRSVVVKDDGQYKIKYIGQAFGVIPESCNPQWEMRVGDDGIEREYLTVIGLVWKKFSDPLKIIERDEQKSQSMELSKVFSGEWKDDNLFHFDSFEFDGACLLGTGVLPAMNSATGEIYFTTNKFMEYVTEQMRELKEVLFSSMTNNEEEVGQMPTKLELLQNFSFTQEMIAEKGIDFEAISVEELEAKLKEFSATDPVDPVDPVDPQIEFTVAVVTDFSLSSEQLVDELRRALREKRKAYSDDANYTYQEFWYVDSLPDTGKVICYDVDDNYYVGLDYTVNGDVVTINFEAEQRFKAEWVPMQTPNDEAGSLELVDFVSREHMEYMLAQRENEVSSNFTADTEVETLRTSLTQMEAELGVLRTFQADVETRERETAREIVFTEFATRLSEEEMAEVRETSTEMSANDLRKEMLAVVGAKALAGQGNFSAKPDTQFAKSGVFGVQVNVSTPHNIQPYSHILDKHIGK